MERRPIRVMPPELAQQIAAGEVIERPASAVKELIDNALDAGARHIRIDVREAGLALIRVTDDGHGIPAAELPLAFESHATSKLAGLADLARLATLGFRGEALPSIAAIARVEVQTRAPDEEIGAEIVLEPGGRIVRQAPAAVPAGTRVTVKDLFASLPARRAFVRSLRAESGQIQTVIARYALAQPGVAFDLTIDGRPAFHSPGDRDLRTALSAVYGADILEHLVPVERAEHGIEVTGLAGTPALHRPTRTAIHLAVNGRPVGNRSPVFALEEAYSGFLMVGRHPLAVIHLRLPPDEIDPNIHPSKGEIRLAREREVNSAVHHAVADALLERRLGEREITAITPSTLAATTPAEETTVPLPFATPGQDAPEAAASTEPETPSLMPHLPALRVFGQTKGAFIVAEGPNGLYMIDQHAAHERILFDRFDAQLAQGAIPAQPLLEPITIELEPPQMAALEENTELLAQAGFELEPFGHHACLIRAIPALPRGSMAAALLVREVLDELQQRPGAQAARERALAALACRAAVKAGQTLDVEEMRAIVLDLERTPRPATCPHGRPTMIHLSHLQLEREFGRR